MSEMFLSGWRASATLASLPRRATRSSSNLSPRHYEEHRNAALLCRSGIHLNRGALVAGRIGVAAGIHNARLNLVDCHIVSLLAMTEEVES